MNRYETSAKISSNFNGADTAIIATGKGNEDWNYSAPHGAGRLMSRSEAFEKLSMDEYVRSMSGIYTTSVQHGTLDEAPQAYKPMEEIIRAIAPTAEIADILKVTPQAVSKWENGSTMPDVTLIPAIASFFGVSTDELFDFRVILIINLIEGKAHSFIYLLIGYHCPYCRPVAE